MIFHLFNVCNLHPVMIKNIIMNMMLCIIISEWLHKIYSYHITYTHDVFIQLITYDTLTYTISIHCLTIKNVWYFSLFLFNFFCKQYSTNTFTPLKLPPPNISNIWSKNSNHMLPLCNWPSSWLHPLHNIPSSGTFSVLWSSGNFCNISQNINSKAPVAIQHEKTNRVVWTCKDNYPPENCYIQKTFYLRG